MAGARGIDIAVLSMDTAVSSHYGDLTENAVSWKCLAQLYERGMVVAATIVVNCGAPSETFSAARHVPPPDDLSPMMRRPRPFRSFARLFELDGLRPTE